MKLQSNRHDIGCFFKSRRFAFTRLLPNSSSLFPYWNACNRRKRGNIGKRIHRLPVPMNYRVPPWKNLRYVFIDRMKLFLHCFGKQGGRQVTKQIQFATHCGEIVSDDFANVCFDGQSAPNQDRNQVFQTSRFDSDATDSGLMLRKQDFFGVERIMKNRSHSSSRNRIAIAPAALSWRSCGAWQ